MDKNNVFDHFNSNLDIPMEIIEEAMKGPLRRKNQGYMKLLPDFKSVAQRSDLPNHVKSVLKQKKKKLN